jgi:hypothetical protein
MIVESEVLEMYYGKIAEKARADVFVVMIEKHMFGGKLRLDLNPSDERLERIQDLILERDGERILANYVRLS